jgi:hypothetical protein
MGNSYRVSFLLAHFLPPVPYCFTLSESSRQRLIITSTDSRSEGGRFSKIGTDLVQTGFENQCKPLVFRELWRNLLFIREDFTSLAKIFGVW